jgi:acetyl-CoA carboxylase biotin carboxyl carrier protein
MAWMSKSADSPVDLDQIRELIDLLIEKEVSEFVIEREGIKVKIRRGGAEVSAAMGQVQHVVAAPAPTVAPAAAGTPPAIDAGYEDCTIVTSPMVGTFYRSPDPTSEMFVEIGAQVAEGSPLCIIEAMKLMNEIVAESGGEVAAIFVDNAEPVEFGQRLFAIRPRG